MKKLTLAAALVALTASAAGAADLSSAKGLDTASMSNKNTFAGWYLGVQGGGQFSNLDVADQFDGIDADGLVGGAHLGYNFALGSLVTGPYIEGGLSNVNIDIQGVDALRQDWYVHGGWMLGFKPTDKTLVFGRFGYEVASWSSDIGIPDADVRSWVIGGGIDTMLTQHVSLGVTADYIVPQEITVDSTAYTDLLDASETLRVMGRLTYRQ